MKRAEGSLSTVLATDSVRKVEWFDKELQHFVEEARRCQDICLEAGARKAFQAGYDCIREMIEDALWLLNLIPRGAEMVRSELVVVITSK